MRLINKIILAFFGTFVVAAAFTLVSLYMNTNNFSMGLVAILFGTLSALLTIFSFGLYIARAEIPSMPNRYVLIVGILPGILYAFLTFV